MESSGERDYGIRLFYADGNDVSQRQRNVVRALGDEYEIHIHTIEISNIDEDSYVSSDEGLGVWVVPCLTIESVDEVNDWYDSIDRSSILEKFNGFTTKSEITERIEDIIV